MYTTVVEMVPEYHGRQLRCDVFYDPMPNGTYPSEWDFALNVPTYTKTLIPEGSFNILCKYAFLRTIWQIHKFKAPFTNMD